MKYDTCAREVLLRNFLFGFYGFATFCFALAVGLPVGLIAPVRGLAGSKSPGIALVFTACVGCCARSGRLRCAS